MYIQMHDFEKLLYVFSLYLKSKVVKGAEKMEIKWRGGEVGQRLTPHTAKKKKNIVPAEKNHY